MGKTEKKEKTPTKEKTGGYTSRFCKRNEIPIILLSLSLSFTIFFFSPLDIFLGNQREFVVTFGHVAVPMLLTALVSTLVLVLLLNLLLAVHEKVCTIVSRLLFGLLAAMYTQSLFLNSKMAAITGDDASYKDNDKSVILNLVLLTVIALVPLLLTLLAWLMPKNKVFNAGKGKVVPYLCGLIFAMQLAGTASSVLTADFSKYKKLYTSYLSYEPTLEFSKEGNVVVFLSDRLDSLWMDTIVEEYPDMKEKLDGFTFYQNNISHNTNTFPSIPQMLTNSYYKGEDWTDYVTKSWDGDTVPKTLSENGYHVNLLIDNLTTFSSVGQLEGQCDNIGHCDPEDVSFNYVGSGGIVPTMTILSLAKLSPYMWKTDLVNGFGANLSADFVKYGKDIDDMLPMAIGIDSDLRYNDYIRSHEFTADSQKKTFSYIHLNGAHDSSEELAALYDETIPVDRWVTARGDFEIIFYYMDKLKELGVYDDTTIIILGDHGRAPSEIEREGKDGLESAITTALLIKPAGAEHEELQFDRWSELTNDFFPASIIEYAGIDHKDFGTSFNDVIDGDLHPVRWMQTYDFGGYGKAIYKTLYKITGDARDFNNWEAQDKHE